jgi:hypothetical protein
MRAGVEDSSFSQTLPSLHTKESLQMISAGSHVPRQQIDFSFEVQQRKSSTPASKLGKWTAIEK